MTAKADTKKETLGFQTEVTQLLNLMINSLYSHPEVFLRELISNASDAADKLRFAALKSDKLFGNDPDIKIQIGFDKKSNIVTISDNGIGMNRDEAIQNLGTIAKSGTGEFLKNMTGDQKKDSQLIGQFGVGFYSAFIVAEKVTVKTSKAGENSSTIWESKGDGQFTIESSDDNRRGTLITLHLKDEHKEFADGWRLRSVIRKYSDHISVPVLMQKELPDLDNSQDKTEEKTKDKPKSENQEPEWESVNTAKALWCREKSKITEDEYKEFYKHISHDYSAPLSWSHNKVEGKLEYISLLYIPSKAPFDLYNRDMHQGLKLYVNRVYIMDDAEQFLPVYLRFMKGVVDSNDLSLNVSREILQKDPNVESMKSAFTKRILGMLEKLAKKHPEDYQSFWKEFGQLLKEGPAEDYTNREQVASLLRFSSTQNNSSSQTVSLADYCTRMQENQDQIYYLTAESWSSGCSSPHLEIFKKKEIEVLILSDRVDEWLMSHLTEFNDKKFADVSRGNLDLGKLDTEQDKKQQEEASTSNKDLIDRAKKILEGKAEDVRITNRLTDSPACLVLSEGDMGAQMKNIMKAAGQSVPDSKPIMEINPEHALIKKLDTEQDEDQFSDLVYILFDQANLTANGKLNDPNAYVKRMNKILVNHI